MPTAAKYRRRALRQLRRVASRNATTAGTPRSPAIWDPTLLTRRTFIGGRVIRARRR